MPSAQATFTVRNFTPADFKPIPTVVTALPVGASTMEKLYTGQVTGRSSTLFISAFDGETSRGAYVALESFEGVLDGRAGAFNFMHAAETNGGDRAGEFFSIVSGSGTGDLVSISGGGRITIDADGTHNIRFEYELKPEQLHTPPPPVNHGSLP